MVRVLLALFVCSMASGEDRYVDYSGARMPLYNMDDGRRDAGPLVEEYSDRSPDAPAAFDYKYEEQRDRLDKLGNKIEGHRQYKILKKSQKSDDTEDNEKREDEIAPRFKANRRRKHKYRTKSKDIERESRRATKYIRSRKFDKEGVDVRNGYYFNKVRSREDNSIDTDNFDLRDTTQKIIKRKPRDRTTNRSDNDDIEDEDDVKPIERDDETEDTDRNIEERRRFIVKTSRPDLIKMKPKNYPEYNDYYDMKRVNDMKNKLPGLLRKTQASSTQPPSTRHFQDFTYRRAKPLETTESTTKTTTTTEEIIITRTSELRTDIIPISTNATELSLAEKSRLSILKKAQKKENVRNATWTTKPPVLMQVTRGMQTVVMVEPVNPGDVRFRAKEIFDDSPERIDRAKALMRRKLVAGARSIHELTDNWDEMVCDYIDTSLLDNASSTLACPVLKLLPLSVIFSLCSFACM